MSTFRIGLASVRFPKYPEESIPIAEEAIAQAAAAQARIVCFPECFVPGLRGVGKTIPPPDAVFLEHAWSSIAAAAARARIAVILGTERLEGEALFASALVLNPDGTRAGFQDKVQLDPTEDAIYTSAHFRHLDLP
jgi:predicted amidohydrolase